MAGGWKKFLVIFEVVVTEIGDVFEMRKGGCRAI